MALPAAIAAVSTGVATVKAIDGIATPLGVDSLYGAASDALELAQALRDHTSPSLTHNLRRTMLTSRVYVDGTLGFDPVVPDVIRSAHTLYTSLILNALSLDQMVAGGASVKELLRTIATEHFAAAHVDTGAAFAQFCATEANYGSPSAANKPPHGGYPAAAAAPAPASPQVEKFFGSALVKQDETGHLPYGRMIEIELRAPNATRDTPNIKVHLLVQMLPYMIHPSVAVEFVKLNTSLGVLKRWTMWRAGEIAFWKDFVFSMDVYKQRQRAMKADTSGLLSDYLREQSRKSLKTVDNLSKQIAADRVGVRAGPESRNVANAVMIFSAETLLRTKAATGFDLHDAGARARYFRETYAMLIYVVDPMYNTVTMYMNGIDGVGQYTFDAFKAKGKTNDVVSLMAAISAMTQGQAPRF